MIIGLNTCNRLNFTKETIESLIKYNPITSEYKWIIVDDNSKPDTIDYLLELQDVLNVELILFDTGGRVGITVCMEAMMKEANKSFRENILYLQNDWKTTRKIDFRSIDCFMLENNVGHIRTVIDKGSEFYHRYASKTNLHTGEPIKWEAPTSLGSETVVGGNWHYSDIPCFIKVDLAICLFKNPKISTINGGEGIRVYNAEQFGYSNYLLMNQPFWNLDWKNKYQTPGGRKK